MQTDQIVAKVWVGWLTRPKCSRGQEVIQPDLDIFLGRSHSRCASQEANHYDEDVYAQRIWVEMQKRAFQPQFPSTPTANAWAEADERNSHAKRKRQAAEDAKERSKTILEEEMSKDKAWRQAVQQVSREVLLL